MRRHLFRIGEVFIWLIILFILSGTIMLARYNYKKNFNTYQIFLPDVDGLIEGSPVRLMGIQVGYVNQVNIVGEDVYVSFVVTEKRMKIPQGSMATVEFSGLGGSKSLELYPPKPGDKILSEKLIIPQQPKRINDSLGLLNEMFDKIIGITYTISNFMDQVGIIKKNNKSNLNAQAPNISEILKLSNAWLDKTQQKCEEFKMKDKKNGFKQNQNNK